MNELAIFNATIYFETAQENCIDAIKEFQEACKKVGINADNIYQAALRDSDFCDIDTYED